MYGWLHVAAIETVVSETDIFVSATDNFNIINPYQLFGVGALAHRGLPRVRGFVREVPLAFPAPHLHALGL